MFIHIGKIVEHAGNWLKLEGHAAESETARIVQSVVNYIGGASEVEHAAEVLKKAGFSVMPPSGPPAAPNMDVAKVGGAELKLVLPEVAEPAPGAIVVDGKTGYTDEPGAAI
jgi:hypothetical protein